MAQDNTEAGAQGYKSRGVAEGGKAGGGGWRRTVAEEEQEEKQEERRGAEG